MDRCQWCGCHLDERGRCPRDIIDGHGITQGPMPSRGLVVVPCTDPKCPGNRHAMRHSHVTNATG